MKISVYDSNKFHSCAYRLSNYSFDNIYHMLICPYSKKSLYLRSELIDILKTVVSVLNNDKE